jgi:hypothetical protein
MEKTRQAWGSSVSPPLAQEQVDSLLFLVFPIFFMRCDGVLWVERAAAGALFGDFFVCSFFFFLPFGHIFCFSFEISFVFFFLGSAASCVSWLACFLFPF